MPALDQILTDGYPDKSTILAVGTPGIGKEALGYWFIQSGFIQSGLIQGDFCLYVTRLSVNEVLHDIKGFGNDYSKRVPLWFASSGSQIKYDLNDLAGLSASIKGILGQNSNRRMRVVMGAISSLLMLNQPEIIYSFLAQLLEEVKEYDAVPLATLEEGMHKPEVLVAMQQLFDGVLELKLTGQRFG